MNEPVVINPRERTRESLSSPELEALPAAAALLDSALTLRAANRAFLALCEETAAQGKPLAELLPAMGTLPRAPLEGESLSYLARGADGAPVEATLSRHEGRVGLLARPVAMGEANAALEAAVRAVEDERKNQGSLLSLSREVALAASEDEMVAAIARCIRELFPGRCFCVRIVDTRTYALTSLLAEGRLLEGSRERLAMRRASARKAHVDPRTLPERVLLTDEEPLIFAGTLRGFATPLSAAGQFFGLINLEYPQGLAADPARDEKLLIQLANQAAIGVRNAKLIEELTFVRRYFEELIENANALILVVNRRNEVLVFNRALAQLTGYSRSEVIGHDVANVVIEAAHGPVVAVFERTLAGLPVTFAEATVRAKSGAELKVSLSTSAVTTANGAVEGVIAIGQDLSRQRELERRVIQAEKLASLGQLAAGVVHEINNPLTTITMYVEALLQLAPLRHTEPADIEKLQRIREAAERILKFARDLTSYAKPAQDKAELLDLHAVLDQAARYCEHAFKQSGAVLERAYGKEIPAVRGVKPNLVQVFINLLTNACHAMPAPGGQVALMTRAQDGGVEVVVSDSGSGIAAANLARIFDPFFTTKPEGQGTGLGLTIVQGIIEKHGGTVRVSSTVGRGTSFTIWLPAGEAR
jgi:PAS domain S-box-containing protein